MEEFEEFDDFRDRQSTIAEDGNRLWVYPKRPKGKIYNYRKLSAFVLLAILFAIPFIKVHGDPLLLFNVLERKFIVFGVMFYPQDFHLFVLSMIAFIVFVVLYCDFRTDLLRMDMPADHFYGIRLPAYRILDRRQLQPATQTGFQPARFQ